MWGKSDFHFNSALILQKCFNYGTFFQITLNFLPKIEHSYPKMANRGKLSIQESYFYPRNPPRAD